MRFYPIAAVLLLAGMVSNGNAQVYYQPTSLSKDQTTHADQQKRGIFTGLFGSRTCQPSQQPAPNINISVPAPIQQGPDPATLGMLNNILSGQNQMMYQLGRIQGQQQAYPPMVQPPAPIIVNPPVAPVAPQQPIIVQPFAPPAATPYVNPYPQGIPYQPQVLPIAYNPIALPGGYQPQQLPPQYQPSPLPQQYSPSPLPGSYNPQIIVQPGGGGTPPVATPLPGGYAPQQPLPPGFSPAPQRGGPGGGGGSAPGLDFHFYGPTTPYYQEIASKNGSRQPPAAQPQVYSRMPRQEREKVAR